MGLHVDFILLVCGGMQKCENMNYWKPLQAISESLRCGCRYVHAAKYFFPGGL